MLTSAGSSETYTEELANKTQGYGDCCMMSVCAWGHSRMEIVQDPTQFDDDDHMSHVGDFFQ